MLLQIGYEPVLANIRNVVASVLASISLTSSARKFSHVEMSIHSRD